jgi:LacI family transcriptional regulator
MHSRDRSAEPRYRIGIRLLDWAKGFGNRIFLGILDFMRERHPMEIEVAQASGGDLEPVHIDENWRGDGLLVFRYSETEAKAWRRRGISVVNLSIEAPEKGPRFPQVTADNELCGRMVAEHLLNLGLSEFAFWHDSGRTYSQERLAGFQRALAEQGRDCRVLDVNACGVPMGRRPEWVAKTGRRQMAGLPIPCGLFAKDDISAACALMGLRHAGLRCPDDVAVVGIGDDIVYCHLTTPALSSVPFPGRKIGYAAASLLHRMMAGDRVEDGFRIKIPPGELVERESSGRIELPDAAVSKAMELIRTKAGQGGLTADALARATGTSRESLRRRFHTAIGRPPKQEIDRVRAARIAELLRRTDWTLEIIADKCGFGGADDLSRFFKRVTGSTPGSRRRR